MVKVRLYRPFDASALLAALPATVKSIAVLDRCKEPGASGEPLYMDVVTVLAEKRRRSCRLPEPAVVGGRYGLSSKEFTPAMVKGIFDELTKAAPKNHFTIGIEDDVSHTSLSYDPAFSTEDPKTVRALFYGLGSDGTVGANKNSIKIIGEQHAELRAGLLCLRLEEVGLNDHLAPALRAEPDPVHLPDYARQLCGLPQLQLPGEDECAGGGHAGRGVPAELAVCGRRRYGTTCPRPSQQEMLRKKIEFYVIDGYKVAREAGMGTRINTIMQTCFFAISGVLPREEAIAQIKKSI